MTHQNDRNFEFRVHSKCILSQQSCFMYQVGYDPIRFEHLVGKVIQAFRRAQFSRWNIVYNWYVASEWCQSYSFEAMTYVPTDIWCWQSAGTVLAEHFDNIASLRVTSLARQDRQQQEFLHSSHARLQTMCKSGEAWPCHVLLIRLEPDNLPRYKNFTFTYIPSIPPSAPCMRCSRMI